MSFHISVAGMNTSIHTVSFSPTLRRLLFELQVWCSADCCKADAFRISEAAIRRWLEGERIDRAQDLTEEIAKIEDGLREAEGPVTLAVRDLASDWNLAAFQAFWEKFAAAFAAAVSVCESTDAEPAAPPDRDGK